MKYNTKEFGINNKTGIPQDGADVYGSVFLVNEPTSNNQAATKSYVETVRNVLEGQYVVDGYIPVTSLPSFTGDLIKSEGGTVTVLPNNGVNPGTYTKALVNNEGRITLGMILSETDLPSISFDSVYNRPTTLAGYGITDALSELGGTMVGPLKVSDSLDVEDLANKDLTDSFKMDTNIEIGTIVYKLNNTPSSFFLKCDGRDVSIDTYSVLYSLVGDAFTQPITPGYGTPYLHQFNFNTNTNALGAWTRQGTIPATINSGEAVVTKNRVYLIGGRTTRSTSGSVTAVYTASIDSAGVIGTWTTGPSLPVAINSFEVVVYVDNIYVIGGINNSTRVSTIYVATINTDGTLGAWSLAGNLPVALTSMSCFISRNILTCIGGETSSGVVTTVRQCKLNQDGSLGTWTTLTALPEARANCALLPTANWVYLIGGRNTTTSVSTVYRASINFDGTINSWSLFNNIPAQRQDCSIFSTSGRVYLLAGGTSASTAGNITIYTATIDSAGSLGSWSSNATNLAEAVRGSQIFITSSRLYICGGYSSNSYRNSVRWCSFTGGLNDYSPWYGVDSMATSPDMFRIPDIASDLLYAEKYIRC